MLVTGSRAVVISPSPNITGKIASTYEEEHMRPKNEYPRFAIKIISLPIFPTPGGERGE
jgi:hypothetical protein